MVFLVVVAYGYLPDATERNLWYWNSQAYASSVGGIRSVKETADFLKAKLAPDESFLAIPDNEFAYYSDRPAIWEYRLYFLDEATLRMILADIDAKYFVLPASAQLPDAKWNHVGLAPKSFVERIRAMYPLVYATSAEDVEVYALK
jgi:hypothetical protein